MNVPSCSSAWRPCSPSCRSRAASTGRASTSSACCSPAAAWRSSCTAWSRPATTAGAPPTRSSRRQSPSAIIAAFVLWEAWLTARPNGQPLVDLGLFRSRSFSVGVVLAGLGIFGMFGVSCSRCRSTCRRSWASTRRAPGVRFLPMIAGMVVGAVPADRVAARIGAKITVAIGFAILTAGMIVGSGLTVSTSDAYIAAFTFIVGVGPGSASRPPRRRRWSNSPPSAAASAGRWSRPSSSSARPSALRSWAASSTPPTRATFPWRGLPADVAAPSRGASSRRWRSPGRSAHRRSPTRPETAFVAGMDDATRVAAVIARVPWSEPWSSCPAGRPAATAAPRRSAGSGNRRIGSIHRDVGRWSQGRRPVHTRAAIWLAQCVPRRENVAMSESPAIDKPGLRERKKAKTRAAIQEHALRLFREQGYDATTVEQIADAAEGLAEHVLPVLRLQGRRRRLRRLGSAGPEAWRAQPRELGPIGRSATR
jgi:hypothetical protein